MKQRFQTFYNKNYKKFLVFTAILLILAISYITIFYLQTGDIIRKDVSLTGGTTITVFSSKSVSELKSALANEFSDLIVRSLSDNTGKQTQIIITAPDDGPEKLQTALEDYLGYELTNENSSIEQTSSSLSKDFYKQLIVAVLIAFFWMAAVVFIIFGPKIKLKILVVFLNLLLGILLGAIFLKFNSFILFLPAFILMIILIYIYIKYSIPSFAVILSAFADITLTLALVDLIGMRISTAGIVAFLMLIGYSVDTDVMLVTRMLKRRESSNRILFDAFKTGITMTLTSLIALITALIVIYRFASVLNQIFIILIIGLCFDLFSTWISNASIIKWYVETK